MRESNIKNREEEDANIARLTEQEEYFCQLYANGGKMFAGKERACFQEVFYKEARSMSDSEIALNSKMLLHKSEVSEKIKSLFDTRDSQTNTMAIKLQVTETLLAVMDECSTAKFRGRFGEQLSPAPMRAVAVNAAKALADLFPIKYEQETKIKLEGANGESVGITFNVIAPKEKAQESDDIE